MTVGIPRAKTARPYCELINKVMSVVDALCTNQ
jgi:hypothetical protein